MHKHTRLALMCIGMSFLAVLSLGQTQPVKDSSMLNIPTRWERRGLVLPRQAGHESSVSGDPCIVWDDAIGGWRMVLFYDPPGTAQAICMNRDDLSGGQRK